MGQQESADMLGLVDWANRRIARTCPGIEFYPCAIVYGGRPARACLLNPSGATIDSEEGDYVFAIFTLVNRIEARWRDFWSPDVTFEDWAAKWGF